MTKPHIIIISPALAKANNGNWQTARRWERFLQSRYRVTLALTWEGQPADAMIALHARRSAASITAFAANFPGQPVILALTGTDLYRDIKTDADAQRSLQQATHLIVLQSAGLQELTQDMAAKATVIYQSARSLKPCIRNKFPRYVDVMMIGHLRDEKDPAAFMQAASLVTTPNVRLTHVGGALDPKWDAQAKMTQHRESRYRWLGALPHAATRQLLKRSHILVVTSRMEGGANVIIEAITSGVPVLASDISGNRGMLGEDYAGYFPVGDSTALAHLIDRTVLDTAFYQCLQTQSAERASLFLPAREKTTLLQLMDNALNGIE